MAARFAYQAPLALVFCATSLAYTSPAQANFAPPRDRNAIRAMAGCYEVTYDFAETFALKEGYQIHAPFHDRALEWIEVDRDSGNRISLQHILLTPEGARKHWRQEWELMPSSLFEYKGGFTWERRRLSLDEREGRWVQRVYQIDGAPRYECAAPWVHWGRHVYWQCQAPSPLPRREAQQRSDYNVLVRDNRHSITASGWTHEQDNIKVQSQGDEQTPLVKERGENVYRRINDERCKTARQWWQENKSTWSAIHEAWKEIYSTQDRLRFAPSAEGDTGLWKQLSDLAENATRTGLESDEVRREALALIRSHLLVN